MQRITERDDPEQPLEPLRTEVRGHASAHRLAADEQVLLAAPFACRGDDFPEGALQYRRLIRYVAPRPHIRKIKRDDGDMSRREALRGCHHEWMFLAGTRAMREHEDRRRAALRGIGRRAEAGE